MKSQKLTNDALQILNDFLYQITHSYHNNTFLNLTEFQKAICQYIACQLEYCDVEESGSEPELFQSLTLIFNQEAGETKVSYHELITEDYFRYSYLDIYRFSNEFYIHFVMNWDNYAYNYQNRDQDEMPF